MGVIGNIVNIIIKIILAPIRAFFRVIIWALSIVSSIFSMFTSFPANVIIIISFVIIFVMWVWPNPFAVTYVLMKQLNRLFTNILLPAVNALIQIFYQFLVPFWNDLMDAFFLFWDLFWNGICEGDGITGCKGFEDFMTMLTIIWDMFGLYFNFFMFIVMSVFAFLNEIMPTTLRRSQEYCHTPACDLWDGTPRYDRNMFNGEILYQPNITNHRFMYFEETPIMIHNPGPLGIQNVKQHLTSLEVMYIQILAKIAIAAWEFVVETVFPFIIQTLAFFADLAKVFFLFFEDIIEFFIKIVARLLSKLVYIFLRAVGSVLDNPDALIFDPDYYEGNITSYANENEDDFDSYVSDYAADPNVWMLQNITVGNPKVTQFYLKVIIILNDILGYVVQLPDAIFIVVDKIICVFENLVFCIPFQKRLCAWLFAPPTICTVGYPMCNRTDTNEVKIWPGFTGINATVPHEFGSYDWFMKDGFLMMLEATDFGPPGAEFHYANPHANTPYTFYGCRDYYNQGSSTFKYLEPWWGGNPSVEANIYGRYKDPDPDLLYCDDYIGGSPARHYGRISGYQTTTLIPNSGYTSHNWWYPTSLSNPSAPPYYIGFDDVYNHQGFQNGILRLKPETPYWGCYGPARWCGRNVKIHDHGIFFPWDFGWDTTNWYFEGFWETLNWMSDQFTGANIWYEIWANGFDVFLTCQNLIGSEGSCPCSMCKTDPSQLIHWINYMFTFGDPDLSGYPANYNHPDPAKKCVSVSPYKSIMWDLDEYFYDFFDECSICPTPLGEGCTCNLACQCNGGSCIEGELCIS